MSDDAPDTSATRWDVPAIDGSEGQGYLTAGRLQKLQKEAYDEAWKNGHSDGVAAGQQEISIRAKRYDQLLRALNNPFDQLDETVEAQLVELCIAVVKQLFRREIRLEPGHVIGTVREAIQALPITSRSVKLHLHPDDATLVRESLVPAEGEPAWCIVEDPLIACGGCNVTTENSRIDATVEARLHAVISRTLGDERAP